MEAMGWGPSEARVMAWLLVGFWRLFVWGWRLLCWFCRNPWWALAAAVVVPMFAVGLVPAEYLALWGLVREPVLAVLVMWCAVAAIGPPTRRAVRRFRAGRVQRLGHSVGAVLERPAPRRWLVSKLPEGMRDAATDGLATWVKYRRLRRQVRRDLNAVSGGAVPPGMARIWEQSVRDQLEAKR